MPSWGWRWSPDNSRLIPRKAENLAHERRVISFNVGTELDAKASKVITVQNLPVPVD